MWNIYQVKKNKQILWDNKKVVNYKSNKKIITYQFKNWLAFYFKLH